MATLPKIRNFLWRAASGALAVAERLNTRGLNLDSRCKICKVATESIEHVLFKCSLAQEAWSIAGFQSLPQVGNISVTDCLSAYLHMMNDVLIPKKQRLAIPWILWTIWKNRNMLLYAETQVLIIIQIKQAMEEARTWHELNKKDVPLENIVGLNEETKRWEPPLAGYAKCNFMLTGGMLLFIVEWLLLCVTKEVTYFIMHVTPSLSLQTESLLSCGV